MRVSFTTKLLLKAVALMEVYNETDWEGCKQDQWEMWGRIQMVNELIDEMEDLKQKEIDEK